MLEPWQLDWNGLAEWNLSHPPEATIPSLLEHAISNHAERDLFVLDEQRSTYADIEADAAILARHLLAENFGKGSRIGIMLPNERSFLVSWLAVTRIGAIAITLPSLAKPPEIAKIANHADLALLIAPHRYLHHSYEDRLAEAFPGLSATPPPHSIAAAPFLKQFWLWCDDPGACPTWARTIDVKATPTASAADLARAQQCVHSSDPAGIIYTSGSTSEPKGVIHSQGSFVRQGLKLAVSFDYGPGERAYASMPFFWVGGLTTTLMSLMSAGGTILASRRSGAALLDFLEEQGTTAVVTWPHIMRQLSDDPTFPRRNWPAMRNGLFYDALPADRRPADPSLMGTPIGMTETNGPYTIIDRRLEESHRGSLGRLMPGVDARLADLDSGAIMCEWSGDTLNADSGALQGNLHLRSDVMMLGMVKREPRDVFTLDGWYVTNDIVSFRDGHLFYHGRADDLIKAHGANVSPREVESVIARMPGVAAVHAVGVPDAERGTVVGAVVVPEPGAHLDPGDIRKFSATSLASYKVPRILAIRTAAELPTLASSKVDRRGLVSLLEAERDN